MFSIIIVVAVIVTLIFITLVFLRVVVVVRHDKRQDKRHETDMHDDRNHIGVHYLTHDNHTCGFTRANTYCSVALLRYVVVMITIYMYMIMC